MNPLSAQFSTFAVTALILYFVLRAVGVRRAGDEVAQARRHALWCALIGFFASSSSDWFDTFYQVPEGMAVDYGFWAGLGMAATPAAWLFFIYFAGQFTWPRDLKPQRSASLQPRSLAGLVPKALAIFLGLVLIAAAVALWAVRDVTAMAAQPERTIEREDYWANYPPEDGIRSFAQVLPTTILSLGCVVLAVLGITFLVLLRKPLPGISDHDNRVLRRTWLNRLYRTAIVLVSTLAGSVLHYKARWLSRQNDQYTDTTPNFDMDTIDHMVSTVGQWDSVANYAVAGIALTMLFWRPATNFESLVPERSRPVSRMRDQLFTMQFTTTMLTVLLLIVVGALPAYYSSSQTPLTPARAELTMLAYGSIALVYLLANAAIMTYTHLASRAAATLPKTYRRLPLWSYLIAGALGLASLIVMLWPPVDLLWGVVPARPLVILGLVLLMGGAFAAFRIFVRRLTLPWEAGTEMEIWYRRVLELRALRVVTTALVAMPLGFYPFPTGSVLFALVIFFIPSAFVLERPDLARKRELAEMERTS